MITVTGRKTGNPIETPVNVVRLSGMLTVVSLRSRTWWRNLCSGRAASLCHVGKRFPACGEVVEAPAEVAVGMADYFAEYPGLAKYFNVTLGLDGKMFTLELEHIAGESVLIKLRAA